MADNNTAVGVNSLGAASSGSDNTALGTNTLAAITTGTQNVAVGSQAGKTNAAAGSSGNILIGYNVDVPANPTSNYLNIGGVITGSMSSGGPITLANGFQATTQPSTDNSLNLATTAFVKTAVGAATGAMFKLYSGSVNTSNSTALIDFSTTSVLYPVPRNTYVQLELRITGMTSSTPSQKLTLQFANQRSVVTTSSYADTGSTTPGVLNPYGVPAFATGIFDSVAGEIFTTAGGVGGFVTDGSGTFILNGFSFSSTAVTPNVWLELHAQETGADGAHSYFAAASGFIACNNVLGNVFDGLMFSSDVGQFTFNWALYGIV